MAIFKRKKKDFVVEEIQKSRAQQIDKKYRKGLKKSRESLFFKIKKLATKHRQIDQNYFDDLTEILILADLGVFYVEKIIERLKSEAKVKKIKSVDESNALVRKFLIESYQKQLDKNINFNLKENELNLILITGVNGGGKTTSIAKLAYFYQQEGFDVAVAAADSFRAGAVRQLQIWAEEINIPITIPNRDKEDPGAIVYRAIENAKTTKKDILIIDTAGRLENKKNLMNELAKIKKIALKMTGSDHLETLLVIDATTGQNGVHQASHFNELLNLNGIILTKMDSSAKGGIILAINDYFQIPVKFIGLGEKLADFEIFDIQKYINNLLN